MKMTWLGGPLDGAEEEGERFGNVWSGPDPVDPTTKVVIYVNHGDHYCYDWRATNRANHRLAEEE